MVICAKPRCSKKATYAIPGCKPTHCVDHALKHGMRHVRGGQLCTECNTRASFALPGRRASVCLLHVQHGMINVNKRQCFMCTTRPCFRDTITGVACCATHSDVKTREDVVHAKCVDCPLRPSFGVPGGRAKWCATHADVLMVDLVHVKCLEPKCGKQSHFGEKRAWCQEHAPLLPHELGTESGTKNGQQCQHPGCVKRKSFGIKAAGLTHCKTHATPAMVYLMKPRCTHPDCHALAWHGPPAVEATACAEHKGTGMIPNPRQRCSHPSCHLTGTFDDLTRHKNARFCDAHAPPGARALVVTMCGNCGLPDVLSIQGLCSTCDPVKRERVMHTKELCIKALLDAGGWNYESHDKMLEGGACYSYRPDFVFDALSHMVVLEVDENQHSSYAPECERTRMLAIAQTFGMPTAFVRYNPDVFVCGLSGRKSHMPDAQRHRQLLHWLSDAFHKTDVNGCIALRVCYDGFATDSAAWVRVA